MAYGDTRVRPPADCLFIGSLVTDEGARHRQCVEILRPKRHHRRTGGFGAVINLASGTCKTTLMARKSTRMKFPSATTVNGLLTSHLTSL